MGNIRGEAHGVSLFPAEIFISPHNLPTEKGKMNLYKPMPSGSFTSINSSHLATDMHFEDLMRKPILDDDIDCLGNNFVIPDPARDILIGTRNGVEGNTMVKNIINEYAEQYKNASRGGHSEVLNSIIEKINDHGCRFLEQVEDDTLKLANNQLKYLTRKRRKDNGAIKWIVVHDFKKQRAKVMRLVQKAAKALEKSMCKNKNEVSKSNGGRLTSCANSYSISKGASKTYSNCKNIGDFRMNDGSSPFHLCLDPRQQWRGKSETGPTPVSPIPTVADDIANVIPYSPCDKQLFEYNNHGSVNCCGYGCVCACDRSCDREMTTSELANIINRVEKLEKGIDILISQNTLLRKRIVALQQQNQMKTLSESVYQISSPFHQKECIQNDDETAMNNADENEDSCQHQMKTANTVQSTPNAPITAVSGSLRRRVSCNDQQLDCADDPSSDSFLHGDKEYDPLQHFANIFSEYEMQNNDIVPV